MIQIITYSFRRIIFFLCIALLTATCGKLTAQPSMGIRAEFVRNNTVLGANEVASNVFKLKNLTGKTVRFRIKYSTPAGWSVLGQPNREYEMNSNDSLFIPVRIIPDKNILGGTSYVISAIMISEKNVQFAAENWYVSLPTISKWNAQLPIRSQFFINSQDSSGFSVRLKNDGNAPENIRVTLVPDRRLEVLRASDGGPLLLTFNVPLAPGADTTLYFPVIRKPAMKASLSRDADLRSSPTKETYSIQVLAKSTSSNASWSATMQFIKTGNHMRFYEYGRSSIPLTLEANVYDVLSNGTTMSLDAYGNTSFKKGGLLNYRFQTVFVTNYLNENSFLGNNHYIGYFEDKFSVELGEVNGWGRSLLTGRGVKGTYRLGINTVGAMYTRSPGFFNNYTNEGLGLYHNLRWKRINLTSSYGRNRNKQLDLGNDIYSSNLALKINNYHQVSIGGGYSTDYSFGNIANGMGYEANYSGSYKKLCLTLGGSYGTPEYVLARGVTMFTSRTTYALNLKHSLALSTQNFQQRPSYFVNGSLIQGNYIRSDRYEVRWGINSPGSTVAFKPAYLWEENPSIRVATRQIGMEYNAKSLSRVRFTLMGTAGYASAVDYSLPDFFVSRINAYARWDKFYFSLRYSYGPVQLAEQVRFIKDQINPQSVYLISSYDYWMKDGKILLSTTGNMMYETYFKKINLRLRPELFYYSKNGLRFSFYASFYNTSQGANPLVDEVSGREPFQKISNAEMNMGFGVRKQFGIPVPGRKYVTLKMVIYKDANGNHIQDANEEGVENMLVSISMKSIFGEDSIALEKNSGENLITNAKGEIEYENIPAGVYTVKIVSLTPNGEWFDGSEHEYVVKSRGTIYVPLTRGVRVTGSVMVERDKYTINDNALDLSRIRVTAMDSTGKTYSVLTDFKGEFVMNVPAGIYVLSINEAALGDNYIFIQSKITVDLSRNFENFSITFNATERKRKMEIKKFKNKDE